MNYFLITIIGIILIVGVVFIFRVLKPHPRSTGSEMSAAVEGGHFKIKLRFKQNYSAPNLPDSNSIRETEYKKKLLKPEDQHFENVALNKTVIYIGKQIIIEGKGLWDRDGFYERYSVNKGNYPSNLTDGRHDTIAYPASWFIDYVIDLKQEYDVKKIKLVWGMYGKNKDYITSWKLFSQKEFSDEQTPNIETDWKLVGSGKFPNEETTEILKNVSARRFRIVAESMDIENNIALNWIGIGQFEAYVEKIVKEQS